MIDFIRSRLDIKITLAVTVAAACAVGVYAWYDIRAMRADTERTAERTMEAYAASIKGGIGAIMQRGRHNDAGALLRDLFAPSSVESIAIYNERGGPVHRVSRRPEEGAGGALPAGTVAAVLNGHAVDNRETNGVHVMTYYALIENKQDCHGCHGSVAKVIGILKIDFPLTETDRDIASRRDRIVFGTVSLTLFLTALLAALLRVIVHRPVQELRSAMANVREGSVLPDLPLPGGDELVDMKRRFVEMLSRMNMLHLAKLEREKEAVQDAENRRYRAELEAMFDAMPDGVLLIDASQKILYANPRVRALVPNVGAAGERFPMSEDDGSCPFQPVPAVFARAVTLDRQCGIRLASGDVRHLHCICAPILEDTRVASVVAVVRDMTMSVQTARELEAKTRELLVANRKLSQLAITDSLTLLFNRHRFDEILAREIKRFSRRKYSALALMMIDIDHFKQLNDRYGHLLGDAVLRELARILRENMRDTDTVARFGGEEFVVVMPDTHLDGAEHKAEVLRKRVEQFEFPGAGAPLRCTISIGVAAYSAGLPYDLVHAADLALYRAKRGGRNLVVVDKPDEQEGGNA
jgi:diguanylate cyclase (GGDEF)-like protein